jgi:Uma2 family endonuclease
MQAILEADMFGHASVSIRYPVPPNPEAWVIPEEPVPEATAHDTAWRNIFALLSAWAERQPGRVRVVHDLAVRWLEQYPRTGINPDVCVLDPAPVEIEDDLSSLCLWKPGHVAPRFCVEVVSQSHPHKDYTSIQERYAAMGTPELLVFDPLLYGPRSLGGPVKLQLWRRDATRTFERVHFGAEPVYSYALDAWLICEGRELIIARDRSGKERWLTALEQERAALEQERAALEQERGKRAQLEAELERLRASKA